MASNLGDACWSSTTWPKEALDDTLFPRFPVGMHTEPLRKLAAPKNLLKLWGGNASGTRTRADTMPSLISLELSSLVPGVLQLGIRFGSPS